MIAELLALGGAAMLAVNIAKAVNGASTGSPEGPVKITVPILRPGFYAENRSQLSQGIQKRMEQARRARIAKIYAGHPSGWKPPSAFDPSGRERIHQALVRRQYKSKALRGAIARFRG